MHYHVKEPERICERPFLRFSPVHEGRDDFQRPVERKSHGVALRAYEVRPAVRVAGEVRLRNADVQFLRADAFRPYAGGEEEEGVASLDDGRRALRAFLPFDLSGGRHEGAGRYRRIKPEPHDLVRGDLESPCEAPGELRLDGMALAVFKRDGGDAVRAVLLHRERKAERGVLSAAQHDDGGGGRGLRRHSSGIVHAEFAPLTSRSIVSPAGACGWGAAGWGAMMASGETAAFFATGRAAGFATAGFAAGLGAVAGLGDGGGSTRRKVKQIILMLDLS